MSSDSLQYKRFLGKKEKVSGYIIPLFLFLCMLASPANSQQSNTLYLLNSVPQVNQLNPAVQPACKLFIGIPLLNTLHVNYSNSSFTFNNLVNDTVLEFDAVYNRLNRTNMISAEALAFPLALGYKWNKNYFSFSISERFNTHNSFSKKLAGLALYGNTQFIGDVARFNNNRVNAIYYREYSAGWAIEWDRFTSFGAKAKLLFGKGNINTGASRVRLETDIETFDLNVRGNLGVNSSFPIILSQNASGAIVGIDLKNLNYAALLLNPRNVGLAADFGLIHRFNNELTISASLLDLGMIIWTDELYNVRAELDFLYTGVTEGTDFSAAAYFRDLSDSLVNDIIYEVSSKAYISPLPTQLFLGASYKWKKNIDLGIVLRNVLVNRSVRSSLTASVNATLLNNIQATLSWSYLNSTPYNIGAALAYTGRGFQIYAVSDNVIGLIDPLNTRTINFRFGMNLMLGCPSKTSRPANQERSMVPCPKEKRSRVKKSKR